MWLYNRFCVQYYFFWSLIGIDWGYSGWCSFNWTTKKSNSYAHAAHFSVCVLVFVCLTSGPAFLLCSLTPRFSRLRLASKHSGHTRLVLLSRVFEHFAQMACRRTQRDRETALKRPLCCSQLIVRKICSTSSPTSPAPSHHHCYMHPNCALMSALPSVLTAPQDLQWCLRLVKLKLSLQPLHVCFSFSFFLELFCRTHREKKQSCVTSLVWSVAAQMNQRNVCGLLLLQLVYLMPVFHFTFLITQTRTERHPRGYTFLLYPLMTTVIHHEISEKLKTNHLPLKSLLKLSKDTLLKWKLSKLIHCAVLCYIKWSFPGKDESVDAVSNWFISNSPMAHQQRCFHLISLMLIWWHSQTKMYLTFTPVMGPKTAQVFVKSLT